MSPGKLYIAENVNKKYPGFGDISFLTPNKIDSELFGLNRMKLGEIPDGSFVMYVGTIKDGGNTLYTLIYQDMVGVVSSYNIRLLPV